MVCNLASLVLGNIDIGNQEELEDVISTVVRALDNVIDLNYYQFRMQKLPTENIVPSDLVQAVIIMHW